MNGTPYYTNSSHLPVGYTEDIFSAMDIQDELQTLYTSGTVFHAFLGEKLPSWKAAANLVRKIAENYRLPYYTMSPTYSICKNHGYLIGEQYKCPLCGENTEVYSRITGYYRPVQNWNDGKVQEYKDRKLYDIENSRLKHVGPIEISAEVQTEDSGPVVTDTAKVYLFVTATCPNCKAAMMQLDKHGVSYEKMLANEHVELVNRFGVKQAPSLVIADGDIFEIYRGVSEIKGYLASEKAV